MNSRATRAFVVLVVLALTGCAGGPVTAGPGPSPARSSSTRPAVRTADATAAPSRAASPAPMSESVFCHSVLTQTRPALAELKKLAHHPDGHGVDVADLEAARDRLHALELHAPQHLQGYLHSQVAILDSAVRQVTTGKPRTVPVGDFLDAKTELILDCEMPE